MRELVGLIFGFVRTPVFIYGQNLFVIVSSLFIGLVLYKDANLGILPRFLVILITLYLVFANLVGSFARLFLASGSAAWKLGVELDVWSGLVSAVYILLFVMWWFVNFNRRHKD